MSADLIDNAFEEWVLEQGNPLKIDLTLASPIEEGWYVDWNTEVAKIAFQAGRDRGKNER